MNPQVAWSVFDFAIVPSRSQESRLGRLSGPAYYSRLSCNGSDFLNPRAMVPQGEISD
jgi:hypothetical protein